VVGPTKQSSTVEEFDFHKQEWTRLQDHSFHWGPVYNPKPIGTTDVWCTNGRNFFGCRLLVLDGIRGVLFDHDTDSWTVTDFRLGVCGFKPDFLYL